LEIRMPARPKTGISMRQESLITRSSRNVLHDPVFGDGQRVVWCLGSLGLCMKQSTKEA